MRWMLHTFGSSFSGVSDIFFSEEWEHFFVVLRCSENTLHNECQKRRSETKKKRMPSENTRTKSRGSETQDMKEVVRDKKSMRISVSVDLVYVVTPRPPASCTRSTIAYETVNVVTWHQVRAASRWRDER